jgi:hypothetical protein
MSTFDIPEASTWMCRVPAFTETFAEAAPKFALVVLLPSTSRSSLEASGVILARRSRVCEFPQPKLKREQ